VLSGSPTELAASIAARGGLRGELCLLVAPAEPDAERRDWGEIDAALRAALVDASTSQAAAAIARRYGLPRQDVYRRALALRGDPADPPEQQ
jgi:16S rRNA (cytidine1402-2'-O)-methyltransferase